MDAAYDAPIIRERSNSLGHVAIIDINTRRNMKTEKKKLRAEARRCELLHFDTNLKTVATKRAQMSRECMLGSRTEFGGRMIQVRGYAKILDISCSGYWL